MNRIWKYLFRGTTLAGAALLCVCFWLPLAHGCSHDIVPAQEVERDFSNLFGLYFPFLVAAVTVLLLLLKWVLRRHRIAQTILIVLACVVSVGALGYFGAIWIYQLLPEWTEHGINWRDKDILVQVVLPLIYVFAGVALYALYKCPNRIYFELSIFWCGFLPLVWFSLYGFCLDHTEIMYGLYLAWAASAAMCAGAAAELYRQWMASRECK